jgi:hypothetical protein
MELLERYLQAVRFFLPRRNQDDIVRELSENLISQMEDREEALGRPLTDDERAEILRRHGHPMLVAGRYQTKQQLIGPVFFPIYLFALKLGLGVALIVTVVLAIASAALNGNVIDHLVRGAASYPARAIMVFGWTTLGFAALDLAQSRLKLTHDWDPRSLPKLVKPEDRLSRTNSICEALASSLAALWLMLVPRAPYLLLGPAAALLDLAPIWSVAYVPILALTIATAALGFANFVRPVWTPARSYARIAIQAFGAVLFLTLLRAGEWLTVKPGVTSPDGTPLEAIAKIANAVVEISLLVAFVIGIIEVARELKRLHSRRKSPGAAAHSTTLW